MPKYNIEYAEDYTPLNLKDMEEPEYNVTNENLDILIQTYTNSKLNLQGFDTNVPIEDRNKYWVTYKKDARTKIEFNCNGNKKLTEEDYGFLTTLTDKPCKNGKFIYYTSVRSSPVDLFEGAKKYPSPTDIEISFDDTDTINFRLIYAISLRIKLKITCSGGNSKDFTVIAFKNIPDVMSSGFLPIAFFEISSLDNLSEWIRIKYDFHIPEFTNYRRVPKNKSELTVKEKRSKQKYYKWLPVPGDPTWQNILNNGTYEIFDTQVNKPTLDGNFNLLYKKLNDLINGYLSLRRHELMNTLNKECPENILPLLADCAKIEITGYDIINDNDAFEGLMCSAGGNNFVEVLSVKVPIIRSIKDIPIKNEDIK